MLAFSKSALQDADVLLYVTDVVEDPEKNMDFLEKVQNLAIPVILLINKIDELASPARNASPASPASPARNASQASNASLAKIVDR